MLTEALWEELRRRSDYLFSFIDLSLIYSIILLVTLSIFRHGTKEFTQFTLFSETTS